MTGAHIVDSVVYEHLWSTPAARERFGERGRLQAWLDIIAALALAQADLGLVPVDAAAEIEATARVDDFDLQEIAAGTRESGHSTMGIIRAWRLRLSDEAREWLYWGATVQDVTDTWTGLVMRDVLDDTARDLERLERALAALARDERETVVLGRTHGQPGLPITFGFKAAVWTAEVRRHRERVAQARPRLAVGQLAGAVGTCSFWGEAGLELQARLCARLALDPPDVTWLTARDRVAELVTLLAMVTGTLAKIGREVYELQRPEIGELAEATREGLVGSITMPHKRNPELSEHLGTLGRLVRGAAGLALEGLVHEHERDGAAWKAEWAYLPEACLMSAAALHFGIALVEGLEVDGERMAANVAAQRGYVQSEPVMRALTDRLGKHRAHEVVYVAAMRGRAEGRTLRDALDADPAVTAELAPGELDALLDPVTAARPAIALVDRVLAAGGEAAAGAANDGEAIGGEAAVGEAARDEAARGEAAGA
jgi:adenylosuccinate lyase